MFVGVQLVAESGVTVVPGDFFEFALVQGSSEVRGSRGREEYRFTTMVLRGRRLVSSGREHRCGLEDLPLGLGFAEAPPPVPFELDMDAASSLVLHVRLANRVLLDPGAFSAEVGVQIADAQGRIWRDIPLRRPDVALHWLSRGEFVIDLARVVAR